MSDTNKSGKLKIVLVVVFVLLIVNSVMNVYHYSQLQELQTQTSMLTVEKDNLINDLNTLQAQVDVIDERTKLKNWITIGEYELTPSINEQTFHVTGEKWRFKWNFEIAEGPIQLMDNIRVYDETGLLIDSFELTDKRNEGGIRYLNQGTGDYVIKLQGVNSPEFTFSFIVESYE